MRNHIWSMRFKKRSGTAKKIVSRDRCIHVPKKLQKVYHGYYKFRRPTLFLLTMDSSKQNFINNITNISAISNNHITYISFLTAILFSNIGNHISYKLLINDWLMLWITCSRCELIQVRNARIQQLHDELQHSNDNDGHISLLGNSWCAKGLLHVRSFGL